jgi:hypothetical protein
MRHIVAILFSFCFLMSANAQERATSTKASSPIIGLQIGGKAPAFVLRDQFNREQSNETLKGSSGTILLFFRSADW